MAMKEVITEGLNHLIDIELNDSNEKHGKLNSIHEWYAVILEEIEETYEDIECLHQYRDKIWTKIKKDEEITEIDLNRFDIIVYQSIKELLQVGAMVKKARPLVGNLKMNNPTCKGHEDKYMGQSQNNVGQFNKANGNSTINATQEINYEKGK